MVSKHCIACLGEYLFIDLFRQHLPLCDRSNGLSGITLKILLMILYDNGSDIKRFLLGFYLYNNLEAVVLSMVRWEK